ncbi:alpha/beta fold hydrolase [uncultured Eudoraea sp.]|uniref:alpha/beta fold hydrolase n=1 Tax=uncultured Eudoraea sp. TaxID=1035614 RepID=UPI0026206901|nr:alpha/beta fold hydrolase [uncultured Eudoraea sp.]
MRNPFFYLFLFLVVLVCKAQNGPVSVNPVGLDWLPEKQEVHAGAILVPENHEQKDGKQIQISYIIIKAKDSTSSAFPMIFFSGGPGGNSLNPGMVNFLLEHPMRETRDIILFDQRGIGYSSALPDMSFDAFDIMAKNADEIEELALTEIMILEYKKQCKEQDISPEYYNSIQNAKDVGMLFKHLGYEKYNLFGGSYGTRIARLVQDMFPEFIYSSVLDSPSPLSGDFLLDRLDSYSLALGRIFDYCENNPECKKQYPKLKEDYFNSISRLKQKPISVTMNDSINVTINAQDGIYLLRRLLYQSNSREKAPELIKAFNEEGGEVINEVLEFEYELTGGLNLSMLLSVEKFENFNPANTAELIKKEYEKYPLIPVKLGFFDAFYIAGRNWHNKNLPMEQRKFQDSDIPTLILVNRFDPVTPPKNGYLFKENLSHGTLLVLDEGGHGGGNRDCKNKVIIDFMNNPSGKLDTSCLNLYKE